MLFKFWIESSGCSTSSPKNTRTQMPRKQVLTPAVIVVITSQKVLIGNRSCNQSRCQAVLVRARVCTWVCVRMWVCFMDHLFFCPVTKTVLISLLSFPSLSPSTDRQISLTLRLELLYHSFTSSLKISTAVWRSLSIPLKLDEVLLCAALLKSTPFTCLSLVWI